MGGMNSFRPTRQKTKQSSFLHALSRTRQVQSAARIAHVSPDAVYDWKRKDPDFARQFTSAKRQGEIDASLVIARLICFISDIARPLIPPGSWNDFHDALYEKVIRADQRDPSFTLSAHLHVGARSRTTARVPLMEKRGSPLARRASIGGTHLAVLQ